MKNIELRTTQNVTIQYELASVFDRIVAWLLDNIFKGIVTFVLFQIYDILPYSMRRNEEIFIVFLMLPVWVFYTLLFEWLMQGQTPGKKLMRIQVVKMNGKRPIFYDYMLRWATRLLEVVFTLGVPAIVVIASSENAQRLGDMVANTAVVRIRRKVAITLDDILRLDSISNFQPKYPALRQFKEEDMVMVKTAIESYLNYGNDAHAQVLNELASKFRTYLDIKDYSESDVEFLRSMIREYIVLTR